MAVNSDQVQLRSYQIWEREGCPTGRDWDFWFQAEAELAQEAEAAETPANDAASDAEAAKPAKSSTRKKKPADATA